MNQKQSVERILIAIDFSQSARAAFYEGLQLAADRGAQTWILHVSEPIRSFDFGKRKYVETKEAIERVEEGVQRRIDELWEAGGPEAVDRRKIQMVVRGGEAAQEIVDTAVAKNVDLIVVGAKGDGARQTGTTTERVMRNAPCSVYCVRSND